MITVEKVVDKNSQREAEVARDNEELLRTGKVKSKKGSPWPWIIGAALLILGTWWLLRPQKGSSGNEKTTLPG